MTVPIKQVMFDSLFSLLRAEGCLQTSGQAGSSTGQGQHHGGTWEARHAVLSLLAVYLQASPAVQRLAVLKWNIVAALFGLLWEPPTQKLALDMVSTP